MVISGITVEIGLVMMTSFGFFRSTTNGVVPGGSKRPKRYRGLIPLTGVVFVALPTLIGVCSRNAPTE